MTMPKAWLRWLTLALALLLLDVSVTFENIWPTPKVSWHGELSIELAILLILIVLSIGRGFARSPVALAWISVVWTALVIGRYADVTAPALYGRDVNLYWDLRFMPDVVAMVTTVAPRWLIVVSIAAIVSVLTMLFAVSRLAWRRITDTAAHPAERRTLAFVAIATVILYLAARVPNGVTSLPRFATPVMHSYARQIGFVVRGAMSGSTPLPPSPPMEADLAAVRGADVFVVFVESYGAVSFERRDIADRLTASRLQFAADIRDTGRDVVSAFVESPTFGGSSWLAHISLLSGIEVRDPDTNARLMSDRRDTLVRVFSRRGFRTVALMPGMRQIWPEGKFYAFDDIYSADRLAYRGPEFGWFAIPDQYSLDRLNAFEVERPSRPPLFVFFPTISTHFPFRPTPPYQPDWARMTSERPYDGPAIVRAYAAQPDWENFAPGYVESMIYDYAVVGGYLRTQPTRDFVMIVIGDHQPPAAVSGEGASWNVPVHVITSRSPILDRLRARGFRSGISPSEPALAKMHALLPVFLDAFSAR